MNPACAATIFSHSTVSAISVIPTAQCTVGPSHLTPSSSLLRELRKDRDTALCVVQ